MKVNFYEQTEDELLKFAVIVSRSNGKWVFCKHRERTTYECPGGHREEQETILQTARRELQEETGAISYTLEPICVYSVRKSDRTDLRNTPYAGPQDTQSSIPPAPAADPFPHPAPTADPLTHPAPTADPFPHPAPDADSSESPEPDAFSGEETEETTYGMLYYADIQSFEPELHSEIERIVLWEEPPAECQWTYPEIQPLLLEHVSKILSAR